MKFITSLLTVCLLAVASPAQFIITEVHTGTPDFVEITNVSGAAAGVAGIGIMTSNNALCPAYLAVASGGIAAHDGPYVSASAVIVPAGGTYVFEDLGVAGAVVLTAPIVGPGEHTGFNMSWAGGSHLEVALYAAAAIAPGVLGVPTITGVPLDYVVVEYDVLLPVPGPGNPLADGYRNNPSNAPGVPIGFPGGFWLSGPLSRAAGLDTIFRVGGPLYPDTNSNADWNAVASVAGVIGTPGALNPLGFPGIPTTGVDLGYSAFVGPGSLAIEINTGNPMLGGGEVYTLISLAPLGCVNGPIIGLGLDVIGQITLPLFAAPFHDVLTPLGTYLFVIPAGIPPGIAIQSRSVVAPAIGAPFTTMSNTVYFLTI